MNVEPFVNLSTISEIERDISYFQNFFPLVAFLRETKTKDTGIYKSIDIPNSTMD